MKKIFGKLFISLTALLLFSGQAYCQPELAPWGNLTGIRVDGQLLEFGSRLCVVKNDWSGIKSTEKEMQRPNFSRSANRQIVTTRIDSISFTEMVEDGGKGIARVNVEVKTKEDGNAEKFFFCLSLPPAYGANTTIQADKATAESINSDIASVNNYFRAPVRTVQFISQNRVLKLDFPKPVSIIVKKEQDNTGSHLRFYIPLHSGGSDTTQNMFSIMASGVIDSRPVTLVLNTRQAGNAFEGFGGNFRLQNPRTDPQVIDYCLENLRVAWGRVEMPWRFWQPDKNNDPIQEAKNGKLNPNVAHAMEMAQRLGKMNIPFILSAWSAPSWAIVGPPRFSPGPDGVWGNALNADSMAKIYSSIADYIVYLKENYGAEPVLFSFNESDLGINIRLTGQEHADFIKGLGAYFVKRGLKTKMLLGDNSDATTVKFIYPALNDPATYAYIGAVSFHSWRGWETETLQKWADAAKKINRPLLVGEGSIDAQAWGYPAIFEEPTYALQEISLYLRLLSICQPLSILQWQLTADYSPLVGGGIFGNNEPLRPTQRFWNLKQLAFTPKNLHAMALASDGANISGAALGDNNKGVYAIHLVNNGATRKVTISGIPGKIKSFKIYMTSKNISMKEAPKVNVINGKVNFSLNEGTYTTLISEQADK